MDILVPTEITKMVATRHIIPYLKIHQNAFAARGSGPDPTLEARNTPQTSWLDLAVTSRRRGKGKDGKREKKEGNGRLQKGKEGVGPKIMGWICPLGNAVNPSHHWVHDHLPASDNLICRFYAVVTCEIKLF